MEKVSARIRPASDPKDAERYEAGFVISRPHEASASRPAASTVPRSAATERSPDRETPEAGERSECEAVRGGRELPICEGCLRQRQIRLRRSFSAQSLQRAKTRRKTQSDREKNE